MTVQTTPIRAAAYARYSSDNQRAASIEDQLRNCRKRAQSEDWQIIREFSDAAMSGRDSSRPQYQSMLAAATRKEFDVLIVDDLSRLTRDSVEQERVIRRLEFSGLRIVATSDGYDSTSKGRKIQRAFKGMMNEQFLDDLRERTHRGLSGQAIKKRWCGGRPYGYKMEPILDEGQRDAYGQPSRIGTVLRIDKEQAIIVQEIFQRYVDGASCRTIAADLNARGVPSPGSTWKRTIRRCRGWMGSAVRVIVHNPLYSGRQRWNVSQFVRDPDTNKRKRRMRSGAEWHEFQDETLRIVSVTLYERAQVRTRHVSNPDNSLKSGGKPKFLLSGLLVCDRCGHHYVIADARSYACSGYINGGACNNKVRIRRDVVEAKILDPIRNDLLSPARVQKMMKEMQREVARSVATQTMQSAQVPAELQQLDARLARLRERLQKGDPDIEPDELRIAIDRAQQKRQQLAERKPLTKDSAKVISMLPRAASVLRKQINDGLAGDPGEAMKARIVLRAGIGEIRLEPTADGSLWARYHLHPGVFLGASTGGSGGRI